MEGTLDSTKLSAGLKTLMNMIEERDARIADLESKLAEAERTIEELRASLENVRAELRHSDECLRKVGAGAAEAEALAVWAARRPTIVLSIISIMADADRIGDADILRALREAKGGE